MCTGDEVKPWPELQETKNLCLSGGGQESPHRLKLTLPRGEFLSGQIKKKTSPFAWLSLCMGNKEENICFSENSKPALHCLGSETTYPCAFPQAQTFMLKNPKAQHSAAPNIRVEMAVSFRVMNFKSTVQRIFKHRVLGS